ncbi:hypothetical protein Ssi02_44490 [Sinosporangium siamense]|uniref:Uncharacterized protein n=1 Tax=Sinosporangium siamense TaxID=1367973 RepID=A0A919V892_9ACTN|nr:hypothetical protein Ssi02_44490 [Sinosporangium siamense]
MSTIATIDFQLRAWQPSARQLRGWRLASGVWRLASGGEGIPVQVSPYPGEFQRASGRGAHGGPVRAGAVLFGEGVRVDKGRRPEHVPGPKVIRRNRGLPDGLT